MEMLDTVIEGLIENKLKRTGRSRLPRTPRPLGTKALERRYFKAIRAIVKALRRLTTERIFPLLEPILQQAKVLRPDSKADAYVDDIEQAISDLRVEFLREFDDEKIAAIATRAAYQVEGFNENEFKKIFGEVFGVDVVRDEAWLVSEIRAFVKANVRLVQSIPDEYFKKLEGTITRGAQTGRLGKEIAEDIRKSLNVSESKAVLIARDQVAKFNGQLTQLRQKSVGVEKYRWSTSGDERVRESHAANEGRIFSWDDPPSTGHPGEDIQCRCVAIPVFE